MTDPPEIASMLQGIHARKTRVFQKAFKGGVGKGLAIGIESVARNMLNLDRPATGRYRQMWIVTFACFLFIL